MPTNAIGKPFPTFQKIAERFAALPKSNSLWISLAGFFTLSAAVTLIQQTNFEFAASSGLLVPDVVNMTNSIEELWSKGRFWAPETGLQGVIFIYGWAWLYHPALCLLINAVLLFLSSLLANQLLVKNIGAPSSATLGIFFNPYLVLAMPGPNKELPLIFLTLLVANALVNPKPRWWAASAICLPMYCLRDGYGLLMLLVVFMARLLITKERVLPLAALSLAAIATVFWLHVAPEIPALARNLQIYMELFEKKDSAGSIAHSLNVDPFSTIGALLMYGNRLVYNLASLAFIPVFYTDSGHIYWLGIAYWLYGLAALAASAGCVLRWLLPYNDSRDLAASLPLCAWLLISLSLFIQPRYFMPFLPIAFGVMIALPTRLRLWSILFILCLSLSVTAVIKLTGHPTHTSPIEMVDRPVYLF